MSHVPHDLVGQSLMLCLPGPTLDQDSAALLARTRPAGVILFARNVHSPAQLRTLCAALQRHAATLGLPPLLIAIDQEGGVVSRLPPPFVVPPSQQAQGATGDPAAAYLAAQLTGAQLRAHGVNVNVAPVLDVNCNPANPVIGTRAFGADPAMVSAFGLAALRGYRDSGVIAVVKHFPGHGDTSLDSHLGLPVLPHSLERLEAVELAPFRAAFAAGAPALMSAHVVFTALDATRPATLAPAVMGGLLRERLGFDGLVFTDALDMRAVADRYGPAEAAILARAAGVDLVLPLGDAANQAAVADALCAALVAGRLDPAAFAATARRLAALRRAYALDDEGAGVAVGEADSTLHLHVEEEMGRDLARRGLTVRDPLGLLPLAADTPLLLVDCLQPRFSNAEEAVARAAELRILAQQAFPHLHYYALLPEHSTATWDAAAAAVADAPIALVVTRNAWAVPQQAALLARLGGSAGSIIHLAARGPQDAALLPTAAATLLSYGDPPLAMAAVLERLTRAIPANPAPELH